LMDDLVIQYARKLDAKDFVLKDEFYGSNRKGKREYLKEDKSRTFVKELNKYFMSTVEVPRVRRGQKQEFESLITEEALLFAKYLRGERSIWNPRVAVLLQVVPLCE
jgi:CRISPR/Cas system-associated endonuclease Cas1